MENIVLNTIIATLSKKKYLAIFISFTVFFLLLFVAIPLFTIVGNDLAFQLSTYNSSDYVLLAVLSLLSGLIFTLQLYKREYGKKVCNSVGTYASTASASASGVFASVLGTAVCASCIAPIVAFFGLGFGAVSFVLEYQIHFSLVAIIIMLGALYFIAKNINN